MGDDELAASAGLEAWRLVLVGRLVLNSVAIALNLLNCLILSKLYKKRKAHTSVLTLLYLSYAELTFAISSQLFSVLFLASHTGQEDHGRSSPTEHNKFFVLVALACSGSLKHSSLFVRQWWVVGLLALHCLAKMFHRLADRLPRRGLVRRLYSIVLLVGAIFGLVRLVAEKIPEYFRKDYIRAEQHEAIHRALFTLEFGAPPMLAVPCVAALVALMCVRRRRQHRETAGPADEDDDGGTGGRGGGGGGDVDTASGLSPRLTWSWRSSHVALAIGLLFVVCQGPLILLDRVGSDSPLFINLQDLVISLFSCSYFAVFCAASAAFRAKLSVMCTCTVTPGTAADDTELDSCCEMVAAHRV